MLRIILALLLLNESCTSPEQATLSPITTPAASPAVDTAYIATNATAPDGFPGNCFDPAKFLVGRNDTLNPDQYRYAGRKERLVELSMNDRASYLQRHADLFRTANLYFFSILFCEHNRREITILCTKGDDYDLLWLSYDAENVVNGFDTLAAAYGDGQAATHEYAWRGTNAPLLLTQVNDETFRDDNDTMAYLIDTLEYELRRDYTDAYVPSDGAEPIPQFILHRVPLDLTKHWVTQYPVDAAAKEQRRSLGAYIPEGQHAIHTAIGDLNNDGWNDYALVLQPNVDSTSDGDRDLRIVFTSRLGGFKEKLFLPGFIPGRSAGGFHDPIGEEGYSGIAINGDSLVITLFGGSAWKWQSRSVYRYWEKEDDFFLVKEQGRYYHSPAVSNMEQELPAYEARLAAGEVLSAEENEHFKELKKAEESYRWAPVLYPLGKRPMRQR